MIFVTFKYDNSRNHISFNTLKINIIRLFINYIEGIFVKKELELEDQTGVKSVNKLTKKGFIQPSKRVLIIWVGQNSTVC